MKINISSRIFIIIILLISLFALSSYYSFIRENLEYPSYETILSSDYPINKVVYVEGSVIKINSDGYYIIHNYNNHEIIFNVLGQSPAGLVTM